MCAVRYYSIFSFLSQLQRKFIIKYGVNPYGGEGEIFVGVWRVQVCASNVLKQKKKEREREKRKSVILDMLFKQSSICCSSFNL